MIPIVAQIIDMAGDSERAARLIVAMFSSQLKAADESAEAKGIMAQREKWRLAQAIHRRSHVEKCQRTVIGQKIDILVSSDLKKEISIPDVIGQSSDRSEHFAAFWAAYPRKQGKLDATRAWKKAAPKVGGELKLLALCVAALEWQRKSQQWTDKNGTYVPEPAPYLNKGRWADEPRAPVQSSFRPSDPYRKVL